MGHGFEDDYMMVEAQVVPSFASTFTFIRIISLQNPTLVDRFRRAGKATQS